MTNPCGPLNISSDHSLKSQKSIPLVATQALNCCPKIFAMVMCQFALWSVVSPCHLGLISFFSGFVAFSSKDESDKDPPQTDMELHTLQCGAFNSMCHLVAQLGTMSWHLTEWVLLTGARSGNYLPIRSYNIEYLKSGN